MCGIVAILAYIICKQEHTTMAKIQLFHELVATRSFIIFNRTKHNTIMQEM